ncbi:MAG: formylglycine-generating enzyme family protein [Nitrospinota bacterium]|nr:formylglycine-generating enzyme family protein [Nitrospinota bacterium]
MRGAPALITITLAFAVIPHVWAEEVDSGRILIPAGQATLGTDEAQLAELLAGSGARISWYKDETPEREEFVPAFLVDKTEVTNRRFKSIFADHLYPPNLVDHPVVNVTWAKADEFCKKAGGVLPTERQWERAARGDDGRVYPWGNEFDPEKAMFMGSTGVSRLKVGSFALEQSGENMTGGTIPADSRPQGASPFGALNMAGNVWEWQDGWYDENKKLRLLKGGSWLTPRTSLRAAARLGDDGARLFNDYGFRCVYPSGQ